jgi:hypothetical protein
MVDEEMNLSKGYDAIKKDLDGNLVEINLLK